MTESLPASALLLTSCRIQCYHGRLRAENWRLRPSSLSPGGSSASAGRTGAGIWRDSHHPPPLCACPQPVHALAPRQGASQTLAGPDEAGLGATRGAVACAHSFACRSASARRRLRLLSVASTAAHKPAASHPCRPSSAHHSQGPSAAPRPGPVSTPRQFANCRLNLELKKCLGIEGSPPQIGRWCF